jgi:hypothetical protein
MNTRTLTAGIFVATLFFAAASAHADSVTDPLIGIGAGGSLSAGILTPDFSIQSASGSSPATSPCELMQLAITTTTPSCSFENDIVQSGGPDNHLIGLRCAWHG